MNKFIVVDEDIDSIRIDKYLIMKTGYSRNKIQKLIDSGNIVVNSKEVRNSYIIKADDEIKIIGELKEDIDIKPEPIDLDIIYEDDDLLVVNKPSGMVVHPSLGHYSGTLVNALLYHCNQLSKVNGDVRPGIVHRIDKDTSGLLLVAKNDDSHYKLSLQLQEKTIIRKYTALVHGVISHDSGTIDAPIGRDSRDRKKKTVTDVNAKEAITHFKVLERYNEASLIECQLETGRTHQIRIHMQYINHPIVNDSVYGYKKTINDFGQMLHAKTIGFVHPKTNEYMEFSIEEPKEFDNIIQMFKY